MKIAIVVPGRFHAFDLLRALRDRGHEVVLFTNYPKWAVRRFGISPSCTRSFWVHGVISRIFEWFTRVLGVPYPETLLHTWFGRWACRVLEGERWDIIHAWSGVSEEMCLAPERVEGLHFLMRGSAHIRTQVRILEEEQKRVGLPIDRPTGWMIEREEREYLLTDRIIVLSSFARDSFLQEGIPAEKVKLLPLGSDVRMFRPPKEVVEERARRILSGGPIRVLYVGALSFQKGLWDLGILARSLASDSFRFRALGPVSREAKRFLREQRGFLEIIRKKKQSDLPIWYRWADLFVFPTLQDGYAMVLAQAQAGGLPILATTHCSGPDLIEEGKTGWLFPVRSPSAMVYRLRWCQEHRKELSEMVRFLGQSYQPRDWDDVARDFETISLQALAGKSLSGRDAAEGKS